MRRLWTAMLAALALVVLTASCQRSEPLRIGFLGDLSATLADLGEDGRNGVVLAVEDANRAAGPRRQAVELLVRDIGNTPQGVQVAAQDLLDRGVAALVGPYTSAGVSAALPLAEAARVPIISPTASSARLAGRDDQLLLVSGSTTEYARLYAERLLRQGQRRVAIAFDRRNPPYVEPWLQAFESAYAAAGGTLAVSVGFGSETDSALQDTVRQMLPVQPDGLLFIASGANVARLARQAREQAPQLPLSAAEWAGNAPLPALGGRHVEGLVVALGYDSHDQRPRYAGFREHFAKRFGRPPGNAAAASYDTVMVLVQAAARRQRGQSLRDALLRSGPFQGLQQTIVFDAHGDAARRPRFMRVRDGALVPEPA